MAMTNDPYAGENRYALNAVASSHFAVTPSDSADLPVGVKAISIANEGSGWQGVAITAVNQASALIAAAVTYRVPPGAVITVPLRAQKVWATGIGANITVIAFTD
jgi:hypothetical protein